jgi:hypothetical protein
MHALRRDALHTTLRTLPALHLRLRARGARHLRVGEADPGRDRGARRHRPLVWVRHRGQAVDRRASTIFAAMRPDGCAEPARRPLCTAASRRPDRRDHRGHKTALPRTRGSSSDDSHGEPTSSCVQQPPHPDLGLTRRRARGTCVLPRGARIAPRRAPTKRRHVDAEARRRLLRATRGTAPGERRAGAVAALEPASSRSILSLSLRRSSGPGVDSGTSTMRGGQRMSRRISGVIAVLAVGGALAGAAVTYAASSGTTSSTPSNPSSAPGAYGT